MSGGLLLLRCLIAAVLFSHGLQKSLGWLQGPGLARSAGIFEGLGHHPGRRMVVVAASCEILAATLLALGLLTPLGAAIAAGTLGVAGLSQVFSVKALWNTMGGGEYPLTLAVAALVIGFTGPGAWSLDYAAVVDSWPTVTGLVVLGVAVVAAAPPALRSFQHFHHRQSVLAHTTESDTNPSGGTMTTATGATREEIVARNIALVEEHFHNEAPDTVDKAIALYSDDIVWEGPSRGLVYRDAKDVKEMYLGIYRSLKMHSHTQLHRFATEEWVFDDCIYVGTLVGDEMANMPFPVGTRISVRLVHAFQIRDGKICRENAYELWRREGDVIVNDDIPEGAITTYYD